MDIRVSSKEIDWFSEKGEEFLRLTQNLTRLNKKERDRFSLLLLGFEDVKGKKYSTWESTYKGNKLTITQYNKLLQDLIIVQAVYQQTDLFNTDGYGEDSAIVIENAKAWSRIEWGEYTTAKYNINDENRSRRQGVAMMKGRRILCVETNEVFDTFVDIIAKYNIPRQSVYFSCRYGWAAHGKHFRYLDA